MFRLRASRTPLLLRHRPVNDYELKSSGQNIPSPAGRNESYLPTERSHTSACVKSQKGEHREKGQNGVLSLRLELRTFSLLKRCSTSGALRAGRCLSYIPKPMLEAISLLLYRVSDTDVLTSVLCDRMSLSI